MSKRAGALAHQRLVLEKSLQRSIEATRELTRTLAENQDRLSREDEPITKKDSAKRR